jgi:ATP-binding cassette subfamily C protein
LIATASAAGLNKRLKHLGQEAQHNRAIMVQAVKEGLEGVKEVRLLQRVNYFTGRLMTSFSRTLQVQRIMQLIQNGLPSLIELITIFGLLGVVITMFASGQESETIIPVLTVFTVALVRMKGAVRSVMRDYTEIRHSSVSLDVVYNGLVGLERQTDREHQSTKRIAFSESIEIRDVWYRYPGSDAFSLKEINLAIRKGEAIGFVGSTGAGKSTLLDLILGILPPTRGELFVDGQPIHQSLQSWQLNLGYIPQMVFLVDGSIKENVALGIQCQDIDQARLEQAIKAANLLPLINKLPEGVDTVVGERGIRLSGGERQRIAIARALYGDPGVLVMDEATSALDNVTEKTVMQAVEALKGDRTILIIAHRLSTVINCDRIVLLKDGKIDSVGKYYELLESHPEFMKASG